MADYSFVWEIEVGFYLNALHHLTWVKWKYPIHVSSKPKALCPLYESMLWGVLLIFW